MGFPDISITRFLLAAFLGSSEYSAKTFRRCQHPFDTGTSGMFSTLPNTAQIFYKDPDTSFWQPKINSAIHLQVTARKHSSIGKYYEAGYDGFYPRQTRLSDTGGTESAAEQQTSSATLVSARSPRGTGCCNSH